MARRFSFFILFLFLLSSTVSKTVLSVPEEDRADEAEEKLGFVPVETTPEEEYAERVRASVKEEEPEETETDAQSADDSGDRSDSGLPPVSAETMNVIAERMKSLTQSLNNMPEPPSFKHKINLPGDGIVRQEAKNEQEEQS